MLRSNKVLVVIGLILTAAVVMSSQVMATRYESPNYTIDASVGNSFGGDTESANYKMTSSGGESVIGNGAGGSYMLGQGYVSQLEQGIELSVQPLGLEAYYPLDTASGVIAYDQSANSYNGELQGGAGWASGQIGSALQLSADGDHVSVADSPPLSSGEFTTSAWIKLDTPLSGQSNNYPAIISQRGSNKGFAVYLFKGEEEIQVSIGDGTTRTIRDPSTAGVDWTGWHQVAATFGAQQLTVYLDGEIIGQYDLGHDMVASDGDLWIGDITDFQNSNPEGLIDEVKLYSRVLSPNEIKAEYAAGAAGVSAGLAFADDIVAGVSQTLGAEAVILTDAPGYSLGISQDANLSSGSATIPAISGSITTPLTWDEGVTKGLGFTIASASATAPDGKWNTGNSYAALPSSVVTFYNRTGYSGGSKDIVEIRYRVDVDTAQVAGEYSNEVTYTGTAIP